MHENAAVTTPTHKTNDILGLTTFRFGFSVLGTSCVSCGY